MYSIQCLDSTDSIYKEIKYHFYIIDVDDYEMGLCVNDDKTEFVLVTLFHWKRGHGHYDLDYFASDEEQTYFLKVYFSKRGRYFNYKRKRVYFP